MPPYAIVKDDEAIRSKKGVYFLGKDIREVPCLRSSLLLGVIGGTFTGIMSFMFTSQVRMSCHIGFGSLWVFVFAYWIPCRYKFEARKLEGRHKAAKTIFERNTNETDTSLAELEESNKE